jgi:general stress protein 26
MTRRGLLEFLKARRYAVQSSVASDGAPQAAVVGFAVSDAFEIVFDTLADTRKARNLLREPRIALVFGSLERDVTLSVQYEGVVDQPIGQELERLVELYLGVFPDGRERQSWPGLMYLRVTPTWLRYSDFSQDPPEILEFDAAGLLGLR